MDGYHRTSFSPFAGFYVLSYEGPGVPWQKLVKVGDEGEFDHAGPRKEKLVRRANSPRVVSAEYVNVLANNTALATVEAKFQRAEIAYGTIKTAGVGEFHVLYSLA